MDMTTELISFGSKIPAPLKDQIDTQREATKLPMMVIVERLAEFWAVLTPEQQKDFCYGTHQKSLAALIDDRVAAAFPDAQPPVSVERAVMAMKNAIQIYPRLPATDKKLVDDFLGGLDIIRQAGGVPAKASARGKSPKQSRSRRGSAKGA